MDSVWSHELDERLDGSHDDDSIIRKRDEIVERLIPKVLGRIIIITDDGSRRNFWEGLDPDKLEDRLHVIELQLQFAEAKNVDAAIKPLVRIQALISLQELDAEGIRKGLPEIKKVMQNPKDAMWERLANAIRELAGLAVPVLASIIRHWLNGDILGIVR